MDSHSETPKPTSNLISRREFLRRAKNVGIATAAGAAEVTFRPLGNIVDFAARQGWLGEGHPLQRMSSFEKIIQMIELAPKDPVKRELMATWLKLNGAELYSLNQNMFLTARTLRHFLYGRGQTLDITSDYQTSLMDSREKWMIPSSYRTIPYMVGSSISNTLNYTPNLKNEPQEPFIFRMNRDRYLSALVSNQPVPFDISCVVYNNMDDADLRNSINQYTFTVKGQQIASERHKAQITGDPDYYQVTIADPQISLYDRYDWDANTEFGGSGSIGAFINSSLESMGVTEPYKRLRSLLGDNKYDELQQAKVEVKDKEVQKLVQYGLGYNYDIVGAVDVGDRLSIDISAPTLEKAFGIKL